MLSACNIGDANLIVKAQIDSLEGQDGITLSGGDPMYQVDACLELAKYIKSKKMNIRISSGESYSILTFKTIYLSFNLFNV